MLAEGYPREDFGGWFCALNEFYSLVFLYKRAILLSLVHLENLILAHSIGKVVVRFL